MKGIHIKKPDMRGTIEKIKNLNKEDIKEWWNQKKKRREAIFEKRRNSAFAQKMKPVYRFMNRFSLLCHMLLACMLELVIETVSRHSLFEALEFMTDSGVVFLYNAFIIFITFTVVYIVKRRVFARILLSVFWLFIGVCNGYMLIKRVTPFNVQDLKVASDAISLVNSYFNPLEMVLLIIGIAAVIIWVISMWKRGGQFEGKTHRIVATIGVLVWAGIFSVVTGIAIDKRVVSTYFGNIAFAYEDYGFPYCFSASIFNTGISEPNGYDKTAMEDISENGKIIKATTGREEMPNILFVQLESFFDTNEVEFMQTSEDPLPNFRALSEKYSSGYFKVPSVGAGTANTEFEVLTGMNMRYFGPGEYPYKTVLKNGTNESAATALKKFGYGAHVLHNNGGNFYSRAEVFNNIGFDTFQSKEFMNILQKTENGWAKDDILTQQMIDAMDTTEQQDFVFTITVQSHGNYPEEKILENPKITVSGIEEEGKKNSWEYYVNQVYEVDQFVGDLVQSLKDRGEPTVLVLYGDHLPTMGLESEDLTGRYLYNTNYVIWDNIGLQKEDRNVPAFQIMADVFGRLDMHTGTIFNYHQERRKTKNYLADLELLQYDILYGKKYVYNEKNLVVDSHMQMGIKDVELTEVVSHLDDTFSLYGENFTQGSKVYLNGEKQKTEFLNNTRLELTGSKIADGDKLEVSQVGSGNTVFRTSKTYIYKEGKLTEASESLGNLTGLVTEAKDKKKEEK